MSKSMSISGWIRRMAIAPMIGANLLSASFLLLSSEAALAQTPIREGSPANSYGAEAVQAYLTSCNAAAEGQTPPQGMTQQQFQNLMSEMCSCTIWELQNRYTVEEFVSISRGLQNGNQQAGQAMQTVVAACFSS
ncbi:MAG: hypothetical protein AAF685_14665 [Cyanobacteria bacterium P01_C01_bin.89]